MMHKRTTPPQNVITLSSLVEQTNSYVKNFKVLNLPNSEDIIKFIQDATYPNYINATYEHLSCLESGSFRVILSTKRNKANFSTQLVRECNGAIIIVEQMESGLRCRLLTRPAQDCNPKVSNITLVNNSIRNGLYDIYRIDDGTTVNISYLQRDATTPGTWVFSTKGGIDVEKLEWRDRLYGEIIGEVLTCYQGFSFDKLNPSRTYTIGFRHPAFHPFGGSNEIHAWFIQSADVRTGVVSTTDAIGLPTQERARITSQGSKYWQAMNERCKVALDEYVTAMQSPNGDKTIRPFFGFILRSKDRERTKQYSDILIESSLMNEIRKAIYQAPFISNKTVLAEYKNNFKNQKFVQIDSYLDTKKRQLYELLFPQWVPLYHQFDDIVNSGVDQVYQLLGADPHGMNWVSSQPPTAVDKFVVELAPIAGTQVSLIPMASEPVMDEQTAKKLIRSVVVRSKYIDKFMAIFNPEHNLVVVP